MTLRGCEVVTERSLFAYAISTIIICAAPLKMVAQKKKKKKKKNKKKPKNIVNKKKIINKKINK